MKLIFIDTETSHFLPTGALLQLAGFIDIDGEVVDTFNYKLRPYGNEEWSQTAIDKTGITREIAETFTDPHEVFISFNQLLEKYIDRFDKTDKAFFVAYNAKFDEEYIRNWFIKEAKTDRDREFGNGYGCFFWTPSIDIMQLAALRTMKSRQDFPNFQLSTVCQSLGIDFNEEEAHEALYDIRKSRELYYMLKGKKNG